MAQIVCKNGQGEDGYRFNTSLSSGQYKVMFRKDKALHRTDGPAWYKWEVKNTWSKDSKGITKVVAYEEGYYLNGHRVLDIEAFKDMQYMDYDELPLHVNTELAEVVKDRLQHLTETVVDLKHCDELDYILQQIGVTNVKGK